MSDFNHIDHSAINHGQAPRYRRPKFPWFKVVIVALIAGVTGALLVLGIDKVSNSTILNRDGSTVQMINNRGGDQLDGQSKKSGTVHEMIKSVSPTIVGVINIQKTSSVDDLLKGKSSKPSEAGIGSGTIYQINNNSTYIVTSNRVIDGANGIRVRLRNKKQVKTKLVGKDVVTDIAVLKIENTKDIKAIQFVSSSKVQTGDSVFAMGNPLGLQLASSVTSGIISASEHTIDTETTGGNIRVSVPQADVAISPGNSGGALVDISSNLVGINSVKVAATQVEGIGFIILNNGVRVTIEQLVKYGRISRPSTDIDLINLKGIPEEEREQLHTDREDGIYVAKADSDVDLEKGGIITEIDGKKIKDDVDLRSYLYEDKKPGESVTVTVIRDSKTKEVKVKLKQQREQPERQSRSERQSPDQSDRNSFR